MPAEVTQKDINAYLIGTISLVMSAILTAANQVYYAQKIQEISPFTFTFISFLITTIVFLLLSLKNSPGIRENTGKSFAKDLVFLNLSTALAFLTFYYALKYVEPAIVSALEMEAGPIFALLLTYRSYTNKQFYKIDSIVSIGAFLGSLFLLWTALSGRSGLNYHSSEFIIGICVSILCGFGAVLSAIYSKKLSNTGWTSSQILAHRSYAIIAISLSFSLFQKEIGAQLLPHLNWIIIISITGVILPLYMLQIGIKNCDTFFVMVSMTFIPIFTFMFQILDPRVLWSNNTLIGIVLLTLFGLFSAYTKNKR